MFYFRFRQKNLRRPYMVAAFFVPLVIFAFAWYQFICQGSVLNLFLHDDFTHFNPANALPSPFFAADYLWITLGGFPPGCNRIFPRRLLGSKAAIQKRPSL